MRYALFVLLLFVLGAGAGWTAHGLWLKQTAEDVPKIELQVKDGKVVRLRKVVDGDTIVLENGLHVRYRGVDTPETGRFVHDPAPLAERAKKRNAELLRGGRVRLRLGSPHLDRYGRVVARVFALPPENPADGNTTPPAEADVAAILLREGLGRVIGLGLSAEEYQELKAAESEARKNGAGIWGLTKEIVARDTGDKPYCAASGSKIYHRRTCKTAARITPRNLQFYKTPEEAEATGRRPCSRCLPERATRRKKTQAHLPPDKSERTKAAAARP